jgi:hypothetical protein
MSGTGKKADEKVIFQAIIASEAIDAEIHGLIMGLKPGIGWGEKAETLQAISKMPKERIKHLECVFEWLTPQFVSINQSKDMQRKRSVKDGNDIRAAGHDRAVLHILEILPKFGDRFKEQYVKMTLFALRSGNAWVRERAYQEFERGSMRDDLKKEDKSELLSVFTKGLSDPEWDIVYLCVKSIGNLGKEASAAADDLRKMAATHPSKDIRGVAAEALKKIEK